MHNVGWTFEVLVGLARRRSIEVVNNNNNSRFHLHLVMFWNWKACTVLLYACECLGARSISISSRSSPRGDELLDRRSLLAANGSWNRHADVDVGQQLILMDLDGAQEELAGSNAAARDVDRLRYDPINLLCLHRTPAGDPIHRSDSSSSSSNAHKSKHYL